MIRLNGKEVELTPVVSQMTGPITLSLFASDTAEGYVLWLQYIQHVNFS
jgi:hypothetical protein